MHKTFLNAAVFSGLLATSPGLASTIQTTFTGVNGANAFGYYIGEYYGQLESQNVSLFCDDFANEVSFGQKWQANLSKITTGSDLSQTRYGDVANAGKLYQEIAWLDTQFGQTPSAQWGDIHATIWQIFNPATAPNPSSSYWLGQAQSNYSSVSYDNFRVITNQGPVTKTGQVQEFLTILPASSPFRDTTPAPSTTATPEPGTALLMAAGVLLFGLGAKWMRTRSAQKDKMNLATHVT